MVVCKSGGWTIDTHPDEAGGPPGMEGGGLPRGLGSLCQGQDKGHHLAAGGLCTSGSARPPGMNVDHLLCLQPPLLSRHAKPSLTLPCLQSEMPSLHPCRSPPRRTSPLLVPNSGLPALFCYLLTASLFPKKRPWRHNSTGLLNGEVAPDAACGWAFCSNHVLQFLYLMLWYLGMTQEGQPLPGLAVAERQ